VHLLVCPESGQLALGQFTESVAASYPLSQSTWKGAGSGTLWEGRYKSYRNRGLSE